MLEKHTTSCHHATILQQNLTREARQRNFVKWGLTVVTASIPGTIQNL
jgi:hypothetical protein